MPARSASREKSRGIAASSWTSSRAEVDQHGEQAADVGGEVEDLPLVGPAEEARHQDEVRRRAHRQELGEPLHDGEDDGLQRGHGVW